MKRKTKTILFLIALGLSLAGFAVFAILLFRHQKAEPGTPVPAGYWIPLVVFVALSILALILNALHLAMSLTSLNDSERKRIWGEKIEEGEKDASVALGVAHLTKKMSVRQATFFYLAHFGALTIVLLSIFLLDLIFMGALMIPGLMERLPPSTFTILVALDAVLLVLIPAFYLALVIRYRGEASYLYGEDHVLAIYPEHLDVKEGNAILLHLFYGNVLYFHETETEVYLEANVDGKLRRIVFSKEGLPEDIGQTILSVVRARRGR